MLKYFTLIWILILGISVAQQSTYRSPDEIKHEWTEYTDYQRNEMVSFCDFLYQEKYYERCLLTCFQFMYRFPQDPIEPVILYHIARCYEEMENYDLAIKFYKRSRINVDENTILYKAGNNRENYAYLKSKNYEELFRLIEIDSNPYSLIFKGYASMDKMDWVLAKQYFIEAEKQFNHPHYSKILASIYQIIENIQEVPQYKKKWITLSGILPGGGHFLLKDWLNSQGIFFTMSTMLALNHIGNMRDPSGSFVYEQSSKLLSPIISNIKSNEDSYTLNNNDAIPIEILLVNSDLKYKIPPIMIAIGVYGGSIWQASKKTQEKNRGLLHSYIVDKMLIVGPEMFIDFDEPLFIEK